MNEIPTNVRPLIVGEVLFDHFPEGNRVLGGAPFNVAWNLQGLGLSPLFLSAVGDDDDGREIQTRMGEWGLDIAGLQVSPRWPTGEVRVSVQDGQPAFEILDQQAYDDIRNPEFSVSPAEFSLLYYGSLAFRREPSRTTIRRLIQDSGLPRFVDINIRPPWYDRSWLDDLLRDAEWIKLNDQELADIAEMPCGASEHIGRAVDVVRRRYGGRHYFITCGSAGAYAVDESGEIAFAAAPPPEPMATTVGAGDAFAAATIFGISRGRPLEKTLNFAVRFAARACTIQGATTLDRAHYAVDDCADTA